MAVDNNTPILVGVAEVVEPLKENLNEASSAQTLAGNAAELALQDALDIERLAPEIDVVAVTRTFPDSTPMWPMPFGKSNNMPRSIAQRINANPQHAIYTKMGGNIPQSLVNEWSQKLAAGEANMVLLAGAEVIASTKAAIKHKVPLNWAEDIEGSLDDHGSGLQGMRDAQSLKHMLMGAPPCYALCEMARMASQKKSLSTYARGMAELLAPFSEVAASNPYSMSPRIYSAEEIATPSENNGYVAFPYTKAMMAKVHVNQAAALLLTTVGKARALDIDESKWVYLHGYAETVEKSLLEREALGQSLALTAAYQQALKQAGVDTPDLDFIDIYSCFPIVVAEAKAALELVDSDKAMTQTGGLPFFGGPGNNYSMHGIASVARKLRDNPKAFGLVGANGGIMHKHAVGIYSCQPGWIACDSSSVQAELDSQPVTQVTENPEGEARIESYTVQFGRGMPMYAVIIGRLDKTGERFIANSFEGDAEILQALMSKNCVGQRVVVGSTGKGNRVALSKASLLAQMPLRSKLCLMAMSFAQRCATVILK
jgi:acetyl-CoA C-acetyltransferase